MLTERPDLFGAVVCQSPLLDMKRYSKLYWGAGWLGEYGDPDKPEDWAYISRYSPYQNVRPDRKYPAVMFTASIDDYRVDPAHARKMAAKMEDQGDTVLYFESAEGGHRAAANAQEEAYLEAMMYTFLRNELD
jgi:prolyl oligopeptidase